MFGETIDYCFLKPLTHSCDLATEIELNERAKHSTFTLDQARTYLEKVQIYFKNQLPIDPTLSYLDIGCGMGRLTIGLGLAGSKDITGIDILERHIIEAKRVASHMDEDQRPSFFVSDIQDLQTDRRYDVIIVLGAMEHIHTPAKFLKRLGGLLKPNGRAFVSHEPFQSPMGDHMHGFFKVQIPWRGVLFSEKAILRLRRECFRPTDLAKHYKDIAGGLNQMSFSQYIRYVHDAGLEFEFHNHNPQLWLYRHFLPLRPVSTVLTRIPTIRDYFIMTVYSIIKRSH